jgi:hypothetical protein
VLDMLARAWCIALGTLKGPQNAEASARVWSPTTPSMCYLGSRLATPSGWPANASAHCCRWGAVEADRLSVLRLGSPILPEYNPAALAAATYRSIAENGRDEPAWPCRILGP